MNNSVRNKWGEIIGFRCYQCGKVFQQMWNTTCNNCRKKNEEHDELITELKELKKTISELNLNKI